MQRWHAGFSADYLFCWERWCSSEGAGTNITTSCIWYGGTLALGASFLGPAVAKRFCIGSGVFYLALALLGLLIGNPSMNRGWYLGPMLLHTGDHIFHLVLGSVLLFIGLASGREWRSSRIQIAGS